ncbi:MAG: hypothetical protein K1X57_01125 [Gemmataceae bacterium]|nr:hypothetical protein [Gemmataceae bacterium]
MSQLDRIRRVMSRAIIELPAPIEPAPGRPKGECPSDRVMARFLRLWKKDRREAARQYCAYREHVAYHLAVGQTVEASAAVAGEQYAWYRATFHAIREAARQAWPPRSIAEGLLLDQYAQYETLRMRAMMEYTVADEKTGRGTGPLAQVARLQKLAHMALELFHRLRTRERRRPVPFAIVESRQSKRPAPPADALPAS